MLAKSKLLLVCIAVCLICLYWTLLRTSATPPPNLDSYSIEPHSFLPPAPPRTSYKPQDASKEVYATLLSTQLHGDDSKEDKYFNATRVLVHQLLHVNRTMGYRNVLVLVTPAVAPWKKDRLTRDGAIVKDVPVISPPHAVPGAKRWVDTFTKLWLWNMVEYKKILYIDSDHLLLSSPEGAFALDPSPKPPRGPSFAVIPEDDFRDPDLYPYLFAACSDPMNWEKPTPPPTTHYFNAGLFLMAPSRAHFTRLTQLMEYPEIMDDGMMDQALLNYAFSHRGPFPWAHLDWKYNVGWPNFADISAGAIVLHDKFWSDDNPALPMDIADMWFQAVEAVDKYWKEKEKN